ncbi:MULTISPECIES: hypothetical protein [unclassified Neptuniibacter]|uniref:hypothetical protein n=1 Tax=unclassified Neptuniibacter TaxID=2630693 RepID=UPI000C56C9CE|nr:MULTISPECIES: hypothetical protein [unclassified Neptuniibacter]MAY43573.1 hypothetical protein [Oceanospirillaceae bacterium]|tara:strand:- start:28552 stop:28941 length:390 start_codon:yes stop_codon:yes gene_type:complete
MDKLDCYFIGHIAEGETQVSIVKPIRHNNTAFSFTESLGDFLYEFAEKHFYCKKGEEIVLIACSIDRRELDNVDFLSRIDEKSDYYFKEQGTILKRRKAISSDSIELSKRVFRDLHKTHRLILDGRRSR